MVERISKIRIVLFLNLFASYHINVGLGIENLVFSLVGRYDYRIQFIHRICRKPCVPPPVKGPPVRTLLLLLFSSYTHSPSERFLF